MSPRNVTRELYAAAKDLLDAVDGAEQALAFKDNGNGPFVALVDRPQYQDGKGAILRPADKLREALLRWDILAGEEES